MIWNSIVIPVHPCTKVAVTFRYLDTEKIQYILMSSKYILKVAWRALKVQ